MVRIETIGIRRSSMVLAIVLHSSFSVCHDSSMVLAHSGTTTYNMCPGASSQMIA